MAPHVLTTIALPRALREGLAPHYTVLEHPNPGAIDWNAAALADVQAAVTNGSTGFTPAQMDRLPQLKVICAMGSGTENIDIAAARERGIQVANSAGANAATVADHAIGMALGLARGYRPLTDRLARGESWTSLRLPRPSLNKSRVGIIGLGQIGRLIAARALACGATVGYHGPSAKADAPGDYYPTAEGLARDSDFLIASCPGGPATHHLLDARLFEALGPAGFVVNVARGSVLKTADLVDALRAGRIAGAGLDVLEEEPEPPAALLATLAGMDNVLLSPHISGRSPAAILAQLDIMLESLDDALHGRTPRYLVTKASAE